MFRISHASDFGLRISFGFRSSVFGFCARCRPSTPRSALRDPHSESSRKGLRSLRSLLLNVRCSTIRVHSCPRLVSTFPLSRFSLSPMVLVPSVPSCGSIIWLFVRFANSAGAAQATWNLDDTPLPRLPPEGEGVRRTDEGEKHLANPGIPNRKNVSSPSLYPRPSVFGADHRLRG